MADKKITYQDCFYAEKYDKMGVTPFELYCRQNNLCWLELATDEIEGKEFFGDLYCTDGKEYALTKNILNPTFECAKCIVSFLEEVFNNMNLHNELNKTIINILITINNIKNQGSENLKIHMSQNTLSYLEKYLESAIICTDETKPLKILPDNDIILFGEKVELDNSIKDDYLFFLPQKIEVKI